MDNKIPTQEQSEEFWILCGFKYGKYDFVSSLSPELNSVDTGWLSPEATSEPYDSKYFSEEPPDINPTSLLEYAVPELKKRVPAARVYAILTKWVNAIMRGDDPALALFWAVYPALKELQHDK